jgi:hypothetical protein
MDKLFIIGKYLAANGKIITNLYVTSIMVSAPLTIFPDVSRWIVVNQDYITIVLGTVVASHVLGSIVHAFIKRDFTIQKNIVGLILKLSVVTIVGLLFEGFTHITIDNEFLYTYIQMTLRLLTLFYPLRSALLNANIITKGAFPPTSLIQRFEKFNESLDVKDITRETKED